nr:class I SAM-dependent methyltransferase [Deltaproteobacteria bacterium]
MLELGCARGANLLPMALDLPEAEFVGVDLSEVQVAEARRRAEALGLRNVSFRAESVTALSDDAPFDYVICHGVYSWVPPAARDAILAVCRERMRPEGVAYVSFNALPGWNALRTLRDFLLEHAPPGPAVQRVARARLALSVLDESLRAEPSPWSVDEGRAEGARGRRGRLPLPRVPGAGERRALPPRLRRPRPRSRPRAALRRRPPHRRALAAAGGRRPALARAVRGLHPQPSLPRVAARPRRDRRGPRRPGLPRAAAPRDARAAPRRGRLRAHRRPRGELRL